MSQGGTARAGVARRYVAGFAVLAVGIAISVVVLELGALWFYPMVRGASASWPDIRQRLNQQDMLPEIVRGNRTQRADLLAGNEPHPYLGWAMDPESTIEKNGKQVHPSTRLGFLGGDVPAARHPDEVVIAISGGSVAGGLYIEASNRIQKMLSADPRFAGKKIRFENYALAGYKQPQAVMSLAYLLVLGAHFDMWINVDGFNEVVLPAAENLPQRVAAVYPRSWQTIVASETNEEDLKYLAAIYALASARETWRLRVQHSFAARSAFVVMCWDIFDRSYEQRVNGATADLRNWREHRDLKKAYGPVLDGDRVPTEEEVIVESVRIWKESTIQMAHLCAANGIEYFHFIQPNQYLDESKPLNDEERATAWADGGYGPVAQRGYPLLRAAVPKLRAAGVPIFDLTMMFSDESRTIYKDTCCHFTSLGNDLIADRIGAEILASTKRGAQ